MDVSRGTTSQPLNPVTTGGRSTSIKCRHPGGSADDPITVRGPGVNLRPELKTPLVHGSLHLSVLSDHTRSWPCAKAGRLRKVHLMVEERGDRRSLWLTTLKRSHVFHEHRLLLLSPYDAPLVIRVEQHPSQTRISEEQAVAIALRVARAYGRAPVPTVRRLEEGRWVLYVQFNDVTDTILTVEIDADTGRIIRKKIGGGY